jgi:hypothetical protein
MLQVEPLLQGEDSGQVGEDSGQLVGVDSELQVGVLVRS